MIIAALLAVCGFGSDGRTIECVTARSVNADLVRTKDDVRPYITCVRYWNMYTACRVRSNIPTWGPKR